MDKKVLRYAAIVPRWRQAFGEHAVDPHGEGQPVEWLVGADAVGAIVADGAWAASFERLLGPRPPEFELAPDALRLGGMTLDDKAIVGRPGYLALRELLLDTGPAHMFESTHLIYPAGTRLITFSRRAPLRLLYRRLAPLSVELAAAPAASARQ